jgi:hypothetical protein
MLTQKGVFKSSSLRDWKRAKGSPPEKKQRGKKELLTLTLGDNAEGRNEGDDDDDGREPIVPITSSCDRISGY